MAINATLTNVSDTASSVTLLEKNTARMSVIIHNDSTATLYLKYGATASTTSYTYKLEPDAHWEMPYLYRGLISGIWSADASGAARVTELS